MELHRKLYENLPSKEDLENNYGSFFRSANDADGLYIILQKVAEKFGEDAYDIGEEVFKEFGMNYERELMRTPNSVRRVDYLFDGGNIYDITIKDYDDSMQKDVLKLYNEEIRKISYDYLIDEIDAEGIIVALDGSGRKVAFTKCTANNNIGYIDALFFPKGDIYDVAVGKLIEKILSYFSDEKVNEVIFFSNKPFDLVDFEEKLPHIYSAIDSIKRKIKR